MLSDAPGRSLRMSELADSTQSSRSRLSHAVTRLEGLGWVRRSTSTSWRRMGISASLDAEDRPSRISHPASRRRIRYSRRIGTADHHARGPDGSRIRSSQPLADF
jgi:hypothetical protein